MGLMDFTGLTGLIELFYEFLEVGGSFEFDDQLGAVSFGCLRHLGGDLLVLDVAVPIGGLESGDLLGQNVSSSDGHVHGISDRVEFHSRELVEVQLSHEDVEA